MENIQLFANIWFTIIGLGVFGPIAYKGYKDYRNNRKQPMARFNKR